MVPGLWLSFTQLQLMPSSFHKEERRVLDSLSVCSTHQSLNGDFMNEERVCNENLSICRVNTSLIIMNNL